VARLLLGYMQAEGFDDRPPEEKRAIYSALSAVGQDEVVPELEAELHRTAWFKGNHELHRAAIARVLGRIGTPAARAVLERGAQSKRSMVRKASEEGLMGAIHRE